MRQNEGVHRVHLTVLQAASWEGGGGVRAKFESSFEDTGYREVVVGARRLWRNWPRRIFLRWQKQQGVGGKRLVGDGGWRWRRWNRFQKTRPMCRKKKRKRRLKLNSTKWMGKSWGNRGGETGDGEGMLKLGGGWWIKRNFNGRGGLGERKRWQEG